MKLNSVCFALYAKNEQSTKFIINWPIFRLFVYVWLTCITNSSVKHTAQRGTNINDLPKCSLIIMQFSWYIKRIVPCKPIEMCVCVWVCMRVGCIYQHIICTIVQLSLETELYKILPWKNLFFIWIVFK